MYARNALAFVALLSFLGCAGTGKECALPQPAAGNSAEVIVFYPTNATPKYFMQYEPPISIDGCIVGELSYGSYIRYRVSARPHKIRAEATAMASFDVPVLESQFAPGQRVYIKFRVEAGRLHGGLGAHGILAVTNRAYAERKVPALSGIGR